MSLDGPKHRNAGDDKQHHPVSVVHDQIIEFLRQTRLQRVGTYGDLSFVAYGTLLFVANSVCAHAADLSTAYGLDKSTVSRQVRDLVDRDLLTREPDTEHARMQRLRLTPRGRRTLRTLRARQRAQLEHAFASWSPQDVETFSALFERFVGATASPGPVTTTR